MRIGASFRLLPGVYVHQSGGGAVLWAFVLAALGFAVWFSAIVVAAAATMLYAIFLVVRHQMVKRTVKSLDSHALSPMQVKVVGNYTEPKTWGVYRCVAATGASEQSFHLGNHPVRQFELERKHGAAELVMLFTERQDAGRLKQLLSSGNALVADDA